MEVLLFLDRQIWMLFWGKPLYMDLVRLPWGLGLDLVSQLF